MEQCREEFLDRETWEVTAEYEGCVRACEAAVGYEGKCGRGLRGLEG